MFTLDVYSDLFLMITVTTDFKATLVIEIVTNQRDIKTLCFGSHYIFMIPNIMSNFRVQIIHAK